MTSQENEFDTRISRQNISYYDEIAEDYDAILNDDRNNRYIREMVAEKFASLVKGGSVLDFGGGTGMDLGWLVQNDYHVTFCEPSGPMRKIAINRAKFEFPDAHISFLDDNKSDFRNWNAAYPFEYKVDAVIANFAVVNCVPDILFLFEKLALAIKSGGIVLALMLDNSFSKRMKSNMKGTLMSYLTGKTVRILVNYKDKRQQVFIYKSSEIRNAAKNIFDVINIERLRQFGFCLIYLRRK
jgi:SAM-dependent methyltransferase